MLESKLLNLLSFQNALQHAHIQLISTFCRFRSLHAVNDGTKGAAGLKRQRGTKNSISPVQSDTYVTANGSDAVEGGNNDIIAHTFVYLQMLRP